MKKILKRAVAVLLTVCLMASVLMPVSAITIPGENVSKTKTYDFRPTVKHSVSGSTVYPADATGEYDTNDWYFWGTRSTTDFNTTSGFQSNYSNYAHSIVIKLNNIPDSADGKYTFTVNETSSSNATKHFYFVKGDADVTFSELTTAKVKALLGSDTPAGQLDADLNAEKAEKNLGDYIVDGSVYIVFYSADTMSGANYYITSFDVTYNVAGEPQNVLAATVEQTYDFYPYGADAHTDNVFSTGNGSHSYAAANKRYGDGELNWAPVAHGISDTANRYPRYNYEMGTGGSLQIRTRYQEWVALKIKAPAVSGEYSMKLNVYRDSTSTYDGHVYIMEYQDGMAEDAIVTAISSGDYEFAKTGLVCRVPSTSASDHTFDLGSCAFDAGKQYLVVFYANATSSSANPTSTTTNSYMFVRDLVLSREVYEMPDLSKATKFDQIKLVYDHAGDLNVGGASVDLNGYSVSGEILSNDGKGIVTNNGTEYMPLSDGADYKYFAFTTTTSFDANPVVDDDAAYFWFDIVFTDDEAYNRIKEGNSGLKISASLVVVADEVKDATVKFNSTVTGWAEKEATTTDDIAMGVKVTGLDLLTAGNQVGILFSYEAGNTTGNIGNTLTYTAE